MARLQSSIPLPARSLLQTFFPLLLREEVADVPPPFRRWTRSSMRSSQVPLFKNSLLGGVSGRVASFFNGETQASSLLRLLPIASFLPAGSWKRVISTGRRQVLSSRFSVGDVVASPPALHLSGAFLDPRGYWLFPPDFSVSFLICWTLSARSPPFLNSF